MRRDTTGARSASRCRKARAEAAAREIDGAEEREIVEGDIATLPV